MCGYWVSKKETPRFLIAQKKMALKRTAPSLWRRIHKNWMLQCHLDPPSRKFSITGTRKNAPLSKIASYPASHSATSQSINTIVTLGIIAISRTKHTENTGGLRRHIRRRRIHLVVIIAPAIFRLDVLHDNCS